MLRATIFDMDGLLIDSEPFWRQAQVEVLGRLGVPLTVSDTEETMGVRINEVTAYWFERHPWVGPDTDEVASRIVDRVIQLVGEKGTKLDGVDSVIAHFQNRMIRIALATSSDDRLIEAILSKLDLIDAFEVTCSAAHEEFGKPHPAVYLTTAKRLGVKPEECVVFEDSVSGVESGKGAGMTVIAVPAPSQFDDPRFDVADLKLRSLVQFRPEVLDAMFD